MQMIPTYLNIVDKWFKQIISKWKNTVCMTLDNYSRIVTSKITLTLNVVLLRELKVITMLILYLLTINSAFSLRY